jgi:hypothetical protein
MLKDPSAEVGVPIVSELNDWLDDHIADDPLAISALARVLGRRIGGFLKSEDNLDFFVSQLRVVVVDSAEKALRVKSGARNDATGL